MDKNRQNIFFSILTGLLLGLAFTFHQLNFLVFIGVIPLLVVLFGPKKLPPKKYFLYGLTAGFVYFLFVFQWLWGTYPLKAGFGIESPYIAAVIIFVLHLTGAFAMALPWGLFSFLSSQAIGNKKGLLAVPFVFIVCEFLRSYFFGIFWAGPQIFLGPHWTFGNLAYLTSSNSLFLFLAQFIGIYGLSFLIIFINIIFLLLIKNRNRKIIFLSLPVAAALILSHYLVKLETSGGNKITVAVIQTRNETNVGISAKEELSQFNEQIGLLKQAVKKEPLPDFIVFPEGTDFFKNVSIFLDTAEAKDFFSKLSDKPFVLVDNSRLADEKGLTRSRTIYLNSKEGVIGQYDKRLLTPMGEYLPYFARWLVKILSPQTARIFETGRAFSKGAGETSPVESGGVKLGALVCSGVFSPSLNRSLAKKGADIMIVQASTGIFKGHRAIVNQNLDIAKMRAAENRKPLILAANYGLSFFISAEGKIQKIAENNSSQILTEEVVLNSKRTLYNKVGDMPWLVAGFALTALIFTNRKKQ